MAVQMERKKMERERERPQDRKGIWPFKMLHHQSPKVFSPGDPRRYLA